MSDVRIVTAAEATKRDGVVLASGVIRAEDQHRELHRAESIQRPLSPAEARLAESGHLPEAVAPNPAMGVRVVPTVKTDEEIYKEAHRAVSEEHAETAAERDAQREATTRQRLAADFRTHTAHLEKLAREAKGNPAAESRAAEQVRQSAEVGAELKRRGVL